MNKRETGAQAEAVAAAYLAAQGMKIMAHNFRCRQGEVDIIGRHEGYLVFVEVKYRKDREKGSPEEAVDFRKQKQICKVADYYRYIHGLGDSTPVRYDVVALEGEEIRWHRNAFCHIYVHG